MGGNEDRGRLVWGPALWTWKSPSSNTVLLGVAWPTAGPVAYSLFPRAHQEEPAWNPDVEMKKLRKLRAQALPLCC